MSVTPVIKFLVRIPFALLATPFLLPGALCIWALGGTVDENDAWGAFCHMWTGKKDAS